MLHLFKQIYLERDSVIDVANDRVVVSDEHGYPMLESIGGQGELISFARNVGELFGPLDGEQPYSSVTELLLSLDVKYGETNKPIIIYCDAPSFLNLAVRWFKSVLPFASVGDVFKIVKTYQFKTKMFHSYRNRDRVGEPLNFTSEDWWQAWQSISVDDVVTKPFVDSVHHGVSIEYQLATYLYNGGLDAELKRSIMPLARNDAIDWLFEIKEILVMHIMNDTLRTALGLTEAAQFDGLDKFITEAIPPYDVFFDPELWTIPDALVSSQQDSITFEALTPERIDKIKQTVNIIAQVFPAFAEYLHEVDGISKFSMLEYLNDNEFSIAEIDKILTYEASDTKVEGIFHTASHQSVNSYLVDFVLDRHAAGDMEALAPYRLI